MCSTANLALQLVKKPDLEIDRGRIERRIVRIAWNRPTLKRHCELLTLLAIPSLPPEQCEALVKRALN